MGALSADRDALDLLMVVLFGGLGYFMKRFSYPRPPLILGMLLGDLLEKYLYISTASYGIKWLARPSVIVLLVRQGEEPIDPLGHPLLVFQGHGKNLLQGSVVPLGSSDRP